MHPQSMLVSSQTTCSISASLSESSDSPRNEAASLRALAAEMRTPTLPDVSPRKATWASIEARAGSGSHDPKASEKNIVSSTSLTAGARRQSSSLSSMLDSQDSFNQIAQRLRKERFGD